MTACKIICGYSTILDDATANSRLHKIGKKKGSVMMSSAKREKDNGMQGRNEI
jgi:hypothetical protein